VLNLFGALPREGRVIAYNHLTFRVLRMKGTRILELEVKQKPDEGADKGQVSGEQ
jgi:CBS domain containing-hemolysin-like protein